MATIKSYTDISQSKKLAELLPIESADMHYPDYYFDGNAKGPCNTPYKEAIEDLLHVYISPKTKRLLPCWSLAALLGVLPEIQGGKPIIALDDNYITYPHMSDLHTKADNPVDACMAMIEKLHELNLL